MFCPEPGQNPSQTLTKPCAGTLQGSCLRRSRSSPTLETGRRCSISLTQNTGAHTRSTKPPVFSSPTSMLRWCAHYFFLKSEFSSLVLGFPGNLAITIHVFQGLIPIFTQNLCTRPCMQPPVFSSPVYLQPQHVAYPTSLGFSWPKPYPSVRGAIKFFLCELSMRRWFVEFWVNGDSWVGFFGFHLRTWGGFLGQMTGYRTRIQL